MVIIKGDFVSPAPLTAPPIENSIAMKGCIIPSIQTKITALSTTSLSSIKKVESSLEKKAKTIPNVPIESTVMSAALKPES